MKGITEWQASSGFKVLRIHYSADPDKDPETDKGREWLTKELEGVPQGISSAQWRREMEIDWEAAGGDLVFPQLSVYRSRIVVAPFTVPETWDLYASFDYGHRNPSSFHVYALDYDRNPWTVWEYYKAGVGYRDTAKAIRACPYYDKLACAPIADPSIWNQSQETENEMKSVAQLFEEIPELNDEGPVYFAKGKRGGDVTVAEYVNGFLWNGLDTGSQPRWRIFATCPMQIWELEKLRYAEWTGTLMTQNRNEREQIVDRDNHAWDDAKMFFTQFFMGPQRPDPPKAHDKLKTADPRSYREWEAVDKMFRTKKSPESLWE